MDNSICQSRVASPNSWNVSPTYIHTHMRDPSVTLLTMSSRLIALDSSSSLLITPFPTLAHTASSNTYTNSPSLKTPPHTSILVPTRIQQILWKHIPPLLIPPPHFIVIRSWLYKPGMRSSQPLRKELGFKNLGQYGWADEWYPERSLLEDSEVRHLVGTKVDAEIGDKLLYPIRLCCTPEISVVSWG